MKSRTTRDQFGRHAKVREAYHRAKLTSKVRRCNCFGGGEGVGGGQEERKSKRERRENLTSFITIGKIVMVGTNY